MRDHQVLIQNLINTHQYGKAYALINRAASDAVWLGWYQNKLDELVASSDELPTASSEGIVVTRRGTRYVRRFNRRRRSLFFKTIGCGLVLVSLLRTEEILSNLATRFGEIFSIFGGI